MTDTDDVLKIDTPENVTFDYAVAGIGSRFLAALVDTFLIVLLQVIVLGTLILLGLQMGDVLEGGGEYGWVLAILSLIAFIFFWGYYIFFEILWNGQTPGKRWVGLRVIRLDGTPAGAAEVVIRNLVRLIDLLPTAYGVGVISMFVNQNSRRLGDLAAGTVVVHDGQTASLNDLTADRESVLITMAPAPALPAGFPLERLTRQDRQIIADFLVRRSGLANRRQLAKHILKSVYEHLGLSEDAAVTDPEDVLAAIYQQLKARSTE